MRHLGTLGGGALGRSVELKEQLGWRYGAVLTGLSFYLRDGVWSAVIKANFENRPMVAFINVGDFARCVEVAVEIVETGRLYWQPDKRPPKTKTFRQAFRPDHFR